MGQDHPGKILADLAADRVGNLGDCDRDNLETRLLKLEKRQLHLKGMLPFMGDIIPDYLRRGLQQALRKIAINLFLGDIL